jgi:uncharacterized membrane protein HdeD (DUF308 family)
MTFALARNWWSLVVRGVLAIIIGLVTMMWPGITLLAFIFLFGGYALVTGVVSLIGAAHAVAARERWGALLLEGIAGIAAAVITMLWPAITAFSLVLLIAAWAIISGIAEIVAAVRLRKFISGEWLLALGGVASILFGILIAAVPPAGALVIALWFGAYAIVFGAIMVLLGFRLRTWDRLHFPGGGAIPAPAH